MEVHCYYKHSSAYVPGADNLIPLCSYLLAHPVTAEKIISMFPYSSSQAQDSIRFRVKIAGSMLGLGLSEYVWLDIPYEDDSLPLQDLLSDRGFVDVLVVFPHADCDVMFIDAQPASFSETAANANRGERIRFSNQTPALGATGASTPVPSDVDFQSTAMKSMKKGASNIWNAVRTTAERLQQATVGGVAASQSAFVESDCTNGLQAIQNLSDLSLLLSTTYSDALHRSELDKLHRLLFEGQSLPSPSSAESPMWKSAGWQTPHPQSDLKTSGLLAIQAMSYLAEAYPVRSRDMLSRNRTNTKSQYPFAIVGVNLTLLLADVFQLRSPDSIPGPVQQLFASRGNFFEMFCMCFCHMDSLWTSKGAVRTQFGAIIGEIKTLLKETLSHSPQSFDEFKDIAMHVGLTVI